MLMLTCGSAQAQSGNASPAQPSAQKPWWERITFFGDFRTRYEGFFQDNTNSRQRGRFRVRFGLRTAIAEGIDVNLRLASGEAADVASTNQTLTDFFNRKPINLDQLSLAFSPRELRGLTLGAGKFAYPVTRTQMVWDDDVNWEGAFEQWVWTGAPASIRLVAVQAPLNEVGAGEDAFLFGGFGQATFRLRAHTLQISVADYAFQHPDQIAVALDQRTVIRSQQTNTLRRDDQGRVIGFEGGFNLVDVIVQGTFDTGRSAYPVTAVMDYVRNTRATTGERNGVWLAGSYGRATTPGTFATTYTYARIERDAALSAFNFSDMGPATNVVMNMGTVSYSPINRLNFDVTAILTRLLDAQPAAANPMLKRIQVDARVSF
jgi:hypothetical protein